MEIIDKQKIREFLLGELSDQERFDFEERFITDADLFEEIKAMEDELIERYVRNWMDSAERIKFEKHFLTTNKRRERVEFSRHLMEKIDSENKLAAVATVKTNEVNLTEDSSVWNKIGAMFLTPKIAMAGALTLIIGLIGSWVLYQNISLRESEIVKENTNKSLDSIPENITPLETKTPVNTVNETQEETDDNNRNRSVNTDNNLPKKTGTPKINLKQTPKKTPTSSNPKKKTNPTKIPPTQKTPPNPILTLFSGTAVRSGGENNTLNLSKDAEGATLVLKLDSNDYKNYQAQLKDANGNIIFQKDNLKARRSKVNFYIPASKLKRGDYFITLSGKNTSNESESVADYPFRINK